MDCLKLTLLFSVTVTGLPLRFSVLDAPVNPPVRMNSTLFKTPRPELNFGTVNPDEKLIGTLETEVEYSITEPPIWNAKENKKTDNKMFLIIILFISPTVPQYNQYFDFIYFLFFCSFLLSVLLK